MSEDKPAAKTDEEPGSKKDDVLGADAFLRWKFLKEKQWNEQDKVIQDIDKQIASLHNGTNVENGADRPLQELLQNPRSNDFRRYGAL